MTAREFLQVFGTDICRHIYTDIWTDRTMRSIREEDSLMAVISDCRFPNESKAIQKAGGKVIKLTRGISGDSHSSESSVDEIEHDAIIDNKELSLMEYPIALGGCRAQKVHYDCCDYNIIIFDYYKTILL